MEINLLQIAKEYLAAGLSVVPARRDSKAPALTEWKQYQINKPAEWELERWFKPENNFNIGCICGQVSGGLIVIDIDIDPTKPHILEALLKTHPLPETATVKTGSDKFHYYYLVPEGMEIRPDVKIFGNDSPWQVDIRTDGAFCVMPPSIHVKTGKPYEWIVPLEKIRKIDTHWLNIIQERAKNKTSSFNGETKAWETALEGSNDGSRNSDMASIVGKMMRNLPVKMWKPTIPPAMREINNKSKPPKPEYVLKTIYNSIKKTELERRQNNGEIDEEEATPKIRNGPKTIQELYNQDIPPTMWLVDRLIPINSITVLAATSGSFKTWLLMEIAIRVAAKQKVFEEFDVLQDDFGILIVDEENWEGIIQSRLKLLLEEELAAKLDKLPIYFYNLELLKVVNENDINHILKICKEKNIKFVIFDSLNRIHNSDENSATEMNKVFNQMKKLQKEELTVLFTHHNRKQGIFKPQDPAENMRGSGDIKASVDCQLGVEIKLLEEEKTLVIHQYKARAQEELAPFKVKIIKDDNYLHFKHAGVYDTADDKDSKISHYKPEIIAFIQNNPGSSTTDVVDAFTKKLGASYIREALKVLERDIIIKAEGKRPKKYSLHNSVDEINAEEIFMERSEVDPQQGLLNND